MFNFILKYLKLNHIFGNMSYKEKIKTILVGRFMQIILIITQIFLYYFFHFKSYLSIYINILFVIYAVFSVNIFSFYKLLIEKTDAKDAVIQFCLYFIDMLSTVFLCAFAAQIGSYIKLLP